MPRCQMRPRDGLPMPHARSALSSQALAMLALCVPLPLLPGYVRTVSVLCERLTPQTLSQYPVPFPCTVTCAHIIMLP